jgi:catechol 2,3-dioxygenase-like lactoylglutathione lyase family enzyme
MRTTIVFLIGLLAGLLLATTVPTSQAQGTRLAGMDGVNHVGIYVDNFDEAMAFYTQKMGFHEAFTVRDDKGQPTLAYIQVSPNTFIELQPSGANRPVGISHVGLQVEDIHATIASLKQRGVMVEDPRVSSTKSLIANISAPNGVRIELSELTPESLQRKAINTWK